LPGRLIKVGVVRRWGKGIKEWIQCKYCVHMTVNGKKILGETNSWMEEEGIKENGGGGWIQVWYIWYIVRITIYPYPAQQ
jgi:hypothetical protein